MNRFILILPLIFFCGPSLIAFSEADTKTALPAAPQQTQAVVYELRELKPVGLTQYSSVGDSIVRQYFEFKNDQGNHNIIYEELVASPPLRTVAALREIARAWESTCAMDIECTTKAFCTGECKNMYYEVANAPGDTYAPDRNKCRIQYFSCEKNSAQSAPTAPVQSQPKGIGE